MNSILQKNIEQLGERTINGKTHMIYYLAFLPNNEYLCCVLNQCKIEWSIPMVISGTKTQPIFIDRVKALVPQYERHLERMQTILDFLEVACEEIPIVEVE